MDWARVWWTLGLLAFCVVVVALLWVGWRNRAGRQRDLADLPTPSLELGAELALPLTGVYVSTTIAGSWQDRIVVHGLGRRARATLRLYDSGVLVDRVGEEPIWIPRTATLSVGTAPGIAGKVMGTADGILLLTWRLRAVGAVGAGGAGGTVGGSGDPGTVDVASGFRADDPDAQTDWLLAAAATLTPITPGPTAQSGATA